jgi:hypothetical protein
MGSPPAYLGARSGPDPRVDRQSFGYIDAALLVDEHHGARPAHYFVSPIPAYLEVASEIRTRR